MAQLVEQVAVAGEEFIVTKFGKPKAMLIPVDRRKMAGEGSFDEVFGAWKDRKDIGDSGNWVRQLRTQVSLRMKISNLSRD